MPRILIADDSKFARRVTAAIVSEHFPTWDIVEAGDGTEALEKLQQQDFDFATLDMNMPGLDGIEVKQKIDADKPGLEAALLTANIQDTVRERAAAHFVAFLGKPVPEEKLVEVLKQHVPNA